MAPLISHVYELGYMEAVAIPQTECFQGAFFTTSSIPGPQLENDLLIAAEC